MRLSIIVAVLLVLAACDSEATTDPVVTTTAPITASSTTLAGDTCEGVGDDAVVYLERVIDTLDVTPLRELWDPERWGDELRDLQRAGRELDARAGALRCNPAEIQGRAFVEADLTPGGPLSARLVALLLAPAVTETTTTTVGETPPAPDSTTSTVTTTVGG